VGKAKKIGGSLMVIIPKEVAETMAIAKGETLGIEVRKPRRDCFGSLKQLKPFTREEELDTHD